VRRATGALVAVVLIAAGGCRRSASSADQPPIEPPRFEDEEPDGGPSAPSEDPAKEALVAFESARQAILADQDIERGVAHLEVAVRLDPGFGEAWFQLSTAWIEQATVALPVDEQDAVGRLRRGVEAGRKSLELMRAGSLRTWNAFELREAEQQMVELLAAFPDLSSDDRAAAALRDHRLKEGYDEAPAEGEPETPAPAEGETPAPSSST
jgi:hypothetical protein